MTETTTPTDSAEVTDSGVEQSILPEDQSTDTSAVENQEDTTSENDSDNGSNDSTTNVNEDEQKADASLKKFAKSQGFDPENLSETEKKALKLAHDNQRAFRQQKEQASKGALEQEIKSVSQDSEMPDREYFEFRMQQRDLVDNVRQYWTDNPDDRAYEAEAAAILQREKEQYGDEAMWRLAQNMPRLVREAKYAAGAFDPSKVSEEARRAERERLRKIQEGSADTPHATTDQQSSKTTVNADWVRNEYDPGNAEHRKMLDEYTASGGKLY